jgi:hypothetical protein
MHTNILHGRLGLLLQLAQRIFGKPKVLQMYWYKEPEHESDFPIIVHCPLDLLN